MGLTAGRWPWVLLASLAVAAALILARESFTLKEPPLRPTQRSGIGNAWNEAVPGVPQNTTTSIAKNETATIAADSTTNQNRGPLSVVMTTKTSKISLRQIHEARSSAANTNGTAFTPREMLIITVTRPFGQLKMSGLMNQRCFFLFVVRQAQLNGAALDVSSLRWRGGWNVDTSVPHAQLYDVEHWNKIAAEKPQFKLPRMVDLNRLRREGRVLPLKPNGTVDDEELKRGLVRPELNFAESFKATKSSTRELGRIAYAALRPSKAVNDIVAALKPRGEYGAIHMRIEEDLKQAPNRWNARVTARTVLEAVGQSTNVSQCVKTVGPKEVYVAVAMNDVHDPADRALLRMGAEGPWPGTRLNLDPDKKEAAVSPRFGNNSNVVSALVDFEICKSATAFAAGNMGQSSFSWVIADARAHKAADAAEMGGCDTLSFDYASNRTYLELKNKKWPEKSAKWERKGEYLGRSWAFGFMFLRRVRIKN